MAAKRFAPQRWGGDTHDIWIDPTNANRILITHDGGMNITTDHGKTSSASPCPSARCITSPSTTMSPITSTATCRTTAPCAAPAIAQNPADRASATPQRQSARAAAEHHARPWDHDLGGCESGFTMPDVTDTNIVWATCYGDEVTRYDARTKIARSVSPWLHTLDSAPNEAKYRCHWTPPLAIDPFDHNTMYYGCQVIFRTTNGGTSWTVISPDLSHAGSQPHCFLRRHRRRQPRPVLRRGGFLHRALRRPEGPHLGRHQRRQGLVTRATPGAHWNDVTKNITGLPALGRGLENRAVAFRRRHGLCRGRFPFDGQSRSVAYIRRPISARPGRRSRGNLPARPAGLRARDRRKSQSEGHAVRRHRQRAVLFASTMAAHWKQFKDGLPAAPVSWIVVQKNYHDLVVSTYGRGFYILEDLTPLEQDSASVKLFAPRPAYRLIHGARGVLNYSLASEAKAAPKLAILDSAGKVIRELHDLPKEAGVSRVVWNLRMEGPRLVALRTTPVENPRIWEEPRFDKADTRPVTHWGIEQSGLGPIAAPGKYNVRLTVDGQSYTQPLEILLPPASHGTDADIQASVRLQTRVRDDLSSVSDMTNQIERMRKTLEDDHKKFAAQSALLTRIAAIDQRLQDVEYKLISRNDALSDDKYFISQFKLYMNFMWLEGEIGSGLGDVAGSGDYGPTETSLGLVLGLERELQAVAAEYKTLMEKDVPAYNGSLAGTGLTTLK